MTKLGFTFYPKDWWTSDSFFELEPLQRYIYLECLFLMYTNDGYIKTQKTQIENRIRVEISPEDWSKITQLFTQDEFGFTHNSVNKRLRKTLANRENGKKGGRPKKPKKPNLETQKNPPYKEKEKENIKESKENIYFPWSSEEFTECWKAWKMYKSKEFGFKYKSTQSEQSSIKELSNKADGDEQKAIQIITQSMANGWKGFFDLKKNNMKEDASSFSPSNYVI